MAFVTGHRAKHRQNLFVTIISSSLISNLQLDVLIPETNSYIMIYFASNGESWKCSLRFMGLHFCPRLPCLSSVTLRFT